MAPSVRADRGPVFECTHRPSERVGPFRLDRPLGGGSWTEVWRATAADGSAVALKLVRRGVRDPLVRSRLAREVAALDRLADHVGVVRVASTSDRFEVPWVAFELVDGAGLDARLADGPLPVSDAAATVASLASTLAVVHERGIVHRDIKPANVLLAASGPVLADFGVAAMAGTTFDGTGVGSVLGTPDFVAPEAGHGPPLPSEDVFALGVVLLECLTGRRTAPAGWVDPTGGLVVRCLAMSPLERPSAAALADELARWGGGARAPVRPMRLLDAQPVEAERRFEGRDAPLAEIDHHLADAVERDELGVAAVFGPAGSGKSWLLEEAARRAVGFGRSVLVARCESADAGVSVFVSWVRAARRTVGEAGWARLSPVSRRALDALSGSGATTSVDDDVAVTVRVADALVELIAALGPSLCVLDDVHLADDDVIAVVEGIGHRAGAAGLVVCVGRPGDVDADALGAATIALGRLDDEVIASIAAEVAGDVTGEPVSAELVSTVVAAAAGNPLHAREAALASVRGDVIGGRSVADLIVQRVERLAPSVNAALSLAAVCGETFWPELLGSEVVEQVGELVVGGWCDASMRSAVPGSTELRFTHPLLREVPVGRVDAAGVAEMEATVAVRLAAGAVSPRLVAPHAIAAVDGGRHDVRGLAVGAGSDAAREALDRHALAECERLIADVRRLADHPEVGAVGERDDELDLTEAGVLHRRGRAVDALAVVMPLCDRRGPMAVAARRLGAAVALDAGEVAVADRLATASLNDQEPGSLGWASTALVSSLARGRIGRHDEAIALAEQAELAFEACGDRGGQAQAQVARALAAVDLAFSTAGFDGRSSVLLAEASTLFRDTDRRRWVRAAPAIVDGLYAIDYGEAVRLATDAAHEAAALEEGSSRAALAYYAADFAFEGGDLDEVDQWLAHFSSARSESLWDEEAAVIGCQAAAARSGEVDQPISDLLAILARRRAAGDARWSWVGCSVGALLLWAGQVGAAGRLVQDLELDFSAHELVPLQTAFMLSTPHPSPNGPPAIEVGDPRRLDGLAFWAAVEGDDAGCHELLRQRSASFPRRGMVRPLRVMASSPSSFVWALGPPDTDPPVEWFRGWFERTDLPGLWPIQRAAVGMLLAERGVAGFDSATARRLVAGVSPDPEVVAWVGELIDRVAAGEGGR